MRGFLMVGAALASWIGSTGYVHDGHGAAAGLSMDQPAPTASTRVIDNPRVRVYRTTTDAIADVDHAPAIVVALDDHPGTAAGTAVWVDDAAKNAGTSGLQGRIVIVQPLRVPAAEAPIGSKPGDAPFTRMSFKPMFENDRVSVIRARMEVGAREAYHTHASDTVVVHLSGGDIEDTADGKTVVNHWKRGDVEFEGRGTSHSARNVGAAVDVVLVALKAS